MTLSILISVVVMLSVLCFTGGLKACRIALMFIWPLATQIKS
jgi:hypothetical protein